MTTTTTTSSYHSKLASYKKCLDKFNNNNNNKSDESETNSLKKVYIIIYFLFLIKFFFSLFIQLLYIYIFCFLKKKKNLIKNSLKNDNISGVKIKSNLNRAIPVKSASKHKLIRNPSKEFLNLKETIEKQLKMPRFYAASNNNNNTNSLVNKNIIQLDSLGSSAITTDQSANMSLTSFSSSSINDISNKIKLNSKIPTRVRYDLNDKFENQNIESDEMDMKPKLIDIEFKNELERLFSGNE